MLLHYGLVQILRVKAYAQGTIRLMGVGDTHLVGQETGTIILLDDFIEGALNLLPVLYRYLPPGVLEWGNAGICPDGIGPRHVANGVKGAWEGLLQGNDGLRADLVGIMGLWRLGV